MHTNIFSNVLHIKLVKKDNIKKLVEQLGPVKLVNIVKLDKLVNQLNLVIIVKLFKLVRASGPSKPKDSCNNCDQY